MRTGFDSVVREPLQVSWNRKIRSCLYVFIPKYVGFRQQVKSSSNWRYNIISQISPKCGYVDVTATFVILRI